MTCKKQTDAAYTYMVASLSAEKWDVVLDQFRDACLYQTWAFGANHLGGKNMLHFILMKNDRIVAASCVRIVNFPIVKKRIAYILHGPLFRLRESETDMTVFRQAIRVLKNEFVFHRGCILRVIPELYENESAVFLPVFEEEGYSYLSKERKDRTLLIDLKPGIQDLRKGLEGNWRNHLNQAERVPFDIVEGNSLELFDEFITLYEQMLVRKKLKDISHAYQFRKIEKELPDRQKMMIILCRYEGTLCAGAVGSAIGETGVTLLRAVNETGMKYKAAYVVHWRLLQWIKNKKCHSYDLGGIDPQKNYGTYKYKAGLCGRNGPDINYLGRFDSYKDPLFYLLFFYLDKVRTYLRKKFG